MLRRRSAAVVLAGVLVLSPALGVPATANEFGDRQQANEREQDVLERRLDDVRESLEDSSADLFQAATGLEVIRARLPEAEQALAAATKQLESARRQATLVAQRLGSAQEQRAKLVAHQTTERARLAEARQGLGQLARVVYKSGGDLSGLDIALGAATSAEFAERYVSVGVGARVQTAVLDEIQQAAASSRNSETRLEAVETRVAQLKAEAERQTAEAEIAQSAAAQREAEIEQLQAEQTTKVDQIESKRADEEARIAVLERQNDELKANLQEIIRQERAAAATAAAAAAATPTSPGAPAGSPTPAPAPAPATGGALLSPPTVLNYVTSRYGMRLHPILNYYRLHAGTDFRAYCGTPILAAASGTVQWARGVGGFGNQVMLNHGYLAGNSRRTCG